MNPFPSCDHGEYFGGLSRIELALAADYPHSWVFWQPEPAPPTTAALWQAVPFVVDTATLELTSTRTPRGPRLVAVATWELLTDTADLAAYLAARLHRDWVARLTPAADGQRRTLLPLRLEVKHTTPGSPQEGGGMLFRLTSAGATKCFYDAPTTAPVVDLGDFNGEFNSEHR